MRPARVRGPRREVVVLRLVVVSSADPRLVGQVLVVEGPELTLGRETENQLVVSDASVSRRHARLLRAADGWEVEDLSSANGTWVNGERVSRRRLADLDRVRFGGTEMRVEGLAPAVVAPPQPPPQPPPPPPPPQPIVPPPRCASCGGELPSAAVACPRCTPPPALGTAGPASRRAGRPALWLGVGAALLVVVVAATALVTLGGRLLAGRATAADDRGGTGPELVSDPELPPPPPLPVRRTAELATAKIAAAEGGSISSGDGLTLTIPPSSLDRDRTVTVHAAEPIGPALAAGWIGAAGRTPVAVLRTWDVDLGPETGLLPEAVEVALDVAGYPPDRYPLLAPAISADGRTWTRMPSERQGDRLTFTTRHLSPVTLLGLGQAAALALPAAAVIYLVYDHVDEFPSAFNAHAPFIGVDDNPEGVEVFWSTKVPGADPATGFRNQKGYLKALQELAKDYGDVKNAGPAAAISRAKDIRELKRKHLMPDCVRQVEGALTRARAYLASRGIASPMLTMPVYVVPSLSASSGYVHNPWSGRRYMVLSAELAADALNTTALHELFHHYQTGYVWLDRTGHLPLLEASALLMEREAAPHYRRAGHPFNLGEGLELAQMLAYRHGLDGPKEWEEAPVRAFGYGLTWFLEYLRDERWVGTLKNNRAEDFHAALLKQWGGTKYNAIHKSLAWAAGGGDTDLATSLTDFAARWVLEGPVDGCGSRGPFGLRYGCCPLGASPYAGHTGSHGLDGATVELAATPAFTADDDWIRPWSIQFLRFVPPDRARASLAAKVPRQWFPEKGRRRAVLVRPGAEVATPVALADADVAPPSSDHLWASWPLERDLFAYLVDTGQSGSGWVRDWDPASFFLLEPPAGVRAAAADGGLRLDWTPPPSAPASPGELLYFAYLGDQRIGPLDVSGGESGMTAEISQGDLPAPAGGGAPAVAMTSGLEIGRDGGQAVYLESQRSDPTEGPAPPAHEWELSLNWDDSKPDGGSHCWDRFSHWQSINGLSTRIPVAVAADGSLTVDSLSERSFETQESRGKIETSLRGSGTLQRGRATLRVELASASVGEIRLHDSTFTFRITGDFEANGRLLDPRDTGISLAMTGRFDATVDHRFCAEYGSDGCARWQRQTVTCSGDDVTTFQSSLHLGGGR